MELFPAELAIIDALSHYVIDGVLDPTEAFSPLGYVVDLPQRELSAFDPRDNPIRINEQPNEGAVVRWIREGPGRRPFVMLDNGDRALLDTGSSLGLAIRDSGSSDRKVPAYTVRDVGGGQISSRRVAAMRRSVLTQRCGNVRHLA